MHDRSIPGARVGPGVLLVVLLLTASLAVPVGEAAYRPIDRRTTEITGKTLVMVAPAVAELADGTLRGVGMEMEATVRDGSGGVYVDTRPLTQIDMQGSARLAATMAASLSGADLSAYDLFVTMRSPAPAVGGPSAGAAMTVAFTALLLDLPVRDDVVMTGMINPDGSVGPVGGILEKAEAAHDHGASLFLIPEGQAIVRRTVREVEGDGWFPTVTVREEQIDVREHARRSWGMTVREVSDIHEAIRYATDHEIERAEPPAERGPQPFQDILTGASLAQVADATDRLGDLRVRLSESGLRSESPQTVAQLDALLDSAAATLDLAGDAAANGSYYTASSRAFQALITLRSVALWVGALEADDDRAFLQDAGQDAVERLDGVRAEAARMEPGTVSSLEALGAAEVRVMEADELLDQAAAALQDDRLTETVEALAFGIERTRSVTWWLGIAEDLAARDQGEPLRADPADLATDYLGIAQQAAVYAEVLLSQTGTDATTARLLQEASLALAAAQEARLEGLDVGALYLAMEAQVAGHAALSLVGSTDLLGDRLERQRDRALIEVARTRESGAEPFLAVSYLEFADSLSADQPVDALLMYGNAATIAATSGALATGKLCGFGAASCTGGVPSVHRVGVPGPDPWTAYLALATVLLGFVAGVLVTLLVLQARDRREAHEQWSRGMTPGGSGGSGSPSAWGGAGAARGQAGPGVGRRPVRHRPSLPALAAGRGASGGLGPRPAVAFGGRAGKRGRAAGAGATGQGQGHGNGLGPAGVGGTGLLRVGRSRAANPK